MKCRVSGMMAAPIMLFLWLFFGCSEDKPTSVPATVPVLEPFGKDSLAVRKILDTNGLTHIPIGEPYAKPIVVITAGTKDTVKRIGELHLPGRNITILPAHIGRLSELFLLQLDSNSLTSLPAELGNCTALTQINLAHNKLTALPPEIGKLNSLHTLRLSDNKLASIPEQLGNIKALENVWLDVNELTGIPASMGSLTQLKALALNNNKLSDLPATMSQLPRIFLSIGNNNLCALSEELKTWLNDADKGWDGTQNCPQQ